MTLRLIDLFCFTLVLSACGPAVVPEAESSGTDPGTGDAPTTGAAPTSSTTAEPPASTGTSTTGATDVSTSEVATTSSGFIVTPDGGGSGCQPAPFPATGELRLSLCDVFAQDCGRGDKCATVFCGDMPWASSACVEVTGDGVAGDPCTAVNGGKTGEDDCALGHKCWHLDAQDQGTCVPLCTGSPEASVCPGELECLVNFEGWLNLCLPGCDPLVQDCPNGELCGETTGGFFCVADASGDGGAVNDPCAALDACDKGHLCVATADAASACDADAPGCCQPFCSFPGGACPNPDQTCQQYFDPDMGIEPGDEDIGVCRIAK